MARAWRKKGGWGGQKHFFPWFPPQKPGPPHRATDLKARMRGPRARKRLGAMCPTSGEASGGAAVEPSREGNGHARRIFRTMGGGRALTTARVRGTRHGKGSPGRPRKVPGGEVRRARQKDAKPSKKRLSWWLKSSLNRFGELVRGTGLHNTDESGTTVGGVFITFITHHRHGPRERSFPH